MVKQNAARGWLFLLISLIFFALVLYQLVTLWQFVLVSIFVLGGLGVGLYLGFKASGAQALRAVGEFMDQLFVGLAELAGGESQSKGSSGTSAKARVPRPTGYWKAQLIEAVGGVCELQHCRTHRNLEVHHIHEHSKGGSNDLSNLLVLCTEHHKDCRPGGGIAKSRQRYLSGRSNRFNKPSFASKWKNAGFGTGKRNRQGRQETGLTTSW